MGAIGGMLGIGPSAGDRGLGWSPDSAGVLNPVTNAQAGTAYDQSQTALNNQAAFLQALQAQNGIANQSSVFNQLQDVASGQGPNPAQAMLNQATGNNIASQASLMAGQRGSGANAGLIARQAGQMGGNLQQQAAGQAAVMQANQSLGALGQLGGLATQQVGQQASATGAYTNATQGEQQTLLSSIANQNNANVNMTANMNNANAGMAQAGAKQQGQLIGGIVNGAGAAFGMASGGVVPHFANGGVNSSVSDVTGTQTGTAGSAGGAKSRLGKAFGSSGSTMAGDMNKGDNGAYMAGQGIGSAIGKGIGSLFSSSGSLQDTTPGAIAGAGNNFATEGNNFGAGAQAPGNFGAPSLSMEDMGSQFSTPGASLFAKGGKVPAMVSPGEIYLKPQQAEKVAEGKADPKKIGEKIKGKAKVKGDSTENDTVKKSLDEGGVVIKRSVALDENDRKAIDFVKAVMAKSGLK